MNEKLGWALGFVVLLLIAVGVAGIVDAAVRSPVVWFAALGLGAIWILLRTYAESRRRWLVQLGSVDRSNEILDTRLMGEYRSREDAVREMRAAVELAKRQHPNERFEARVEERSPDGSLRFIGTTGIV